MKNKLLIGAIAALVIAGGTVAVSASKSVPSQMIQSIRKTKYLKI